MNAGPLFWQLKKRRKIDYAIIILTFLLVVSNQVFETTPLRASGTIEITNGSAIPQETNCTITTVSAPSVTSAVILNESVEDRGLYFDVPIESVSRIVYNITLQSNLENTSVRIDIRLARFETYIDVIIGILPTSYSFEPDMDLVHFSPNQWIVGSSVRITANIEMILQNVVIWAEFDVPVSPVVIDWQTTDGNGLFENEYTKWMGKYEPQLIIENLNDGLLDYLRPFFQNRTLYLVPQNYTFTPSWDDYFGMPFNITVSENMASICLIHMKAVRVYLSINQDLPVIRLRISRYHYSGYDTYFLCFEGTEVPEFLYIPPISEFTIEIAALSPLSSISAYSDGVIVQATTPINITNHLHVAVTMPYATILGLLITPQDFIQISLAMILFTFIIIRLFLYLHAKKPRTSWKDARLIPILLIGITAFLPWFTSLRDNLYYFDSTIHVLSLGGFPLIASWTENSGIFLTIPENGLTWAFTSLLLFWIPLLLANYFTTPPSDIFDNYLATIPLFSPLLFMANVQWWLSEISSIPFVILSYIQNFIIFVPLIYLICIILLNVTGQYKHGFDYDQLTFDTNLASQPLEKIEQAEETKSESVPIEKDVQKTLNIVLVILQYLLLMIPTSLGFFLRRSMSEYVLDQIYFANPIYGFGSLFDALFGSPGLVIYWIIGVPLCFFYTAGYLSTLDMKSRRGLGWLFLVLWISLPLLIHNTVFTFTPYFYYRSVEWILVTIPYYFLSLISVLKISEYVREEIDFRSLLVWVLLPIVPIIPGGLLLNWISALEITALKTYVTVWVPLPIFTILLLIVVLSLRRWIHRRRLNRVVDSELDELLLPDDVTSDL
ncbi:MAG: hypothetical protein ACTSWA_03210 [Candidatus Thorarchaeota archaeon]